MAGFGRKAEQVTQREALNFKEALRTVNLYLYASKKEQETVNFYKRLFNVSPKASKVGDHSKEFVFQIKPGLCLCLIIGVIAEMSSPSSLDFEFKKLPTANYLKSIGATIMTPENLEYIGVRDPAGNNISFVLSK